MTQEAFLWIALAIALLAAAILVWAVWRGRAGSAAPVADTAATVEPAPPSADIPSPFLPAPDGDPDDLRRIKGIGPKLDRMLREMGVFHYSQIAAWTPEQLALVDSQLGTFTGRPERDQWQSQARLLASGDLKAYEKAHGKIGM